MELDEGSRCMLCFDHVCKANILVNKIFIDFNQPFHFLINIQILHTILIKELFLSKQFQLFIHTFMHIKVSTQYVRF